mgnify:CR=1 FL=1
MIPDRFRINNQHRAVVTAIQTARLVDADIARAAEAQRLDLLLGIGLQIAGAMIVAAAVGGRALVAADEDVVFEVLTHGWGRPVRVGSQL